MRTAQFIRPLPGAKLHHNLPNFCQSFIVGPPGTVVRDSHPCHGVLAISTLHIPNQTSARFLSPDNFAPGAPTQLVTKIYLLRPHVKSRRPRAVTSKNCISKHANEQNIVTYRDHLHTSQNNPKLKGVIFQQIVGRTLQDRLREDCGKAAMFSHKNGIAVCTQTFDKHIKHLKP